MKQKEGDGCPKKIRSWEIRAKQFNCSIGRFYHCLIYKDIDGKIHQACMNQSQVQPGFCPTYKNGIIDYTPCDPSFGDCPDEAYLSKSSYKYPGCLNALTAIGKSKINSSEGKGKVAIIVPCVLGLVVILLLTLLMIYCVRKRRRGAGTGGQECAMEPFLSAESSTKDIGNGAVPCADDKSRSDSATPNAKAKRVPKKSSPHKSLTPRERIDALMNEYLSEEGSSLLLIGDNKEESVKSELRKREENFEVVRCVDDWWTIPNEKKYALILCFLSEGNIASSIRCLESKKEEMLSDIKNRGLHVVTLIGKDVFEKNKEDLECFSLFNGVDPVYI